MQRYVGSWGKSELTWKQLLDIQDGSPQLTDGLIFFGQHDGDDALGDRGVGRIWRVARKILIEIDPMEREVPNRVLS